MAENKHVVEQQNAWNKVLFLRGELLAGQPVAVHVLFQIERVGHYKCLLQQGEKEKEKEKKKKRNEI